MSGRRGGHASKRCGPNRETKRETTMDATVGRKLKSKGRRNTETKRDAKGETKRDTKKETKRNTKRDTKRETERETNNNTKREAKTATKLDTNQKCIFKVRFSLKAWLLLADVGDLQF